MKIIAHGPNLFRLSYLGFVNCYLVREADGFTLVDAAVKDCGKAIVQAAQQLDYPIVRLLLTHMSIMRALWMSCMPCCPRPKC